MGDADYSNRHVLRYTRVDMHFVPPVYHLLPYIYKSTRRFEYVSERSMPAKPTCPSGHVRRQEIAPCKNERMSTHTNMQHMRSMNFIIPNPSFRESRMMTLLLYAILVE